MADTLRNLADVRALLPDNAQQLVAPQDVREYLLALEPDRGGYEFPWMAGPVTVPLTVDVWTELSAVTLPGLIPPSTTVRFTNDAQMRPVPAWGGDVTVPAGFLRSSFVEAVISIDPTSVQNDVFQLAMSYGGTVDVDSALEFLIDANATIAALTFIAEHRMKVDGTEYAAIVIRNRTASRDVAIHNMRMEIRTRPYETAPT